MNDETIFKFDFSPFIFHSYIQIFPLENGFKKRPFSSQVSLTKSNKIESIVIFEKMEQSQNNFIFQNHY